MKIDLRSARPAGTPFHHEGGLDRPAQDCSTTYGGAVAICRVDELTPTSFREVVVRGLPPLPGRYRPGFHTLASIGDRTLIDGKAYSFSGAGARAATAHGCSASSTAHRRVQPAGRRARVGVVAAGATDRRRDAREWRA